MFEQTLLHKTTYKPNIFTLNCEGFSLSRQLNGVSALLTFFNHEMDYNRNTTKNTEAIKNINLHIYNIGHNKDLKNYQKE